LSKSKEEITEAVNEIVDEGLRTYGEAGRTIVQTTEVVDLLLDIKEALSQ